MKRKVIRSLLFVPARGKMLEKIATSDADAWIIDLEDSVAQNEKTDALYTAVKFLHISPYAENCFVRIDRRYMDEQIIALKETSVRGFMIPKVENCDFISEYRDILDKREIIALVETPLGVVGIESIAKDAGVTALAFGAEDYTAAVNMQNVEENLISLKSRLVMYAKAYGKFVYDTPSFSINDIAKADAEAEHSASLGFDGKMAIHPRLIPGVNRAFKMHDIERMRQIVSSYEKQGGAVLVLDGKVYEKMHIDRFKRIIRENQGFNLSI